MENITDKEGLGQEGEAAPETLIDNAAFATERNSSSTASTATETAAQMENNATPVRRSNEPRYEHPEVDAFIGSKSP